MTSLTSGESVAAETRVANPHLDHAIDMRAIITLLAIVAGCLFFAAYSIYGDMRAAGMPSVSIFPFLLLGVAPPITLGFEFVNGFHDQANAVVTVIYTHLLPGTMAANGSGIQFVTLHNIVLVWALTLLCATALLAFLYWMLRHLF